MRTLIFDIETAGEDWDNFDSITKTSLTQWIDRFSRNEEEIEILRGAVKKELGLSPVTGAIIAIGVYDLELRQGIVYYVGESGIEHEVGDFVYKSRTERALLEDFWSGASSYDVFVTFNGRRFDVPFINIRSAIYDIRPSCDLMQGRYLYQQKTVKHIDLQDQLTYYGSIQKRPSLHLFCRAFGITSPKNNEISGEKITELFHQKKFHEIAQYTAGDVLATKTLYERWVTYLAPDSFKNEYGEPY